MHRYLKNPLLYIAAAVIITVGLLFTDKTTDDQFINKEEQVLGKSLQDHLILKRNQAVQFLDSKNLYQALESQNLDNPTLAAIKEKQFDMFCTKNDSLFFWNSNQSIIDSSLMHLKDSVSMVNVSNQSYLVCKRKIKNMDVVLIYRAGSENNHNLPSSHPFYDGENYLYQINGQSNGYLMKWENGKIIANFNLIDMEGTNKIWVFLDLCVLFLIFILVFKYLELTTKKGIKLSSFFIISVYIILLRILLYQRLILQPMLNTDLFNPEIYASSFLLPSLGDLLFHIATFFTLFYCLTKIKKFNIYIPSSQLIWFKSVLVGLIFTFTTDLVFGIIKGLVVDSNISFHFAELPKINIYSFLGMTLSGVLMAGLLSIFGFVIRKSGFRSLPTTTISSSILVAFVTYIVFQNIDGNLGWVNITTTLVFCSIVIVWYLYQPNIKDFYLNILILLIVSGFSAFIINYNSKAHEEEYLNLFVNKILLNQDLEAESKFSDMENELIKEFITPQDFKDFFKHHDEYEKRIKNLYFSGYLDKFELRVISFDSTGVSINPDSRFTYEVLERIYAFESFPTISNHFYQIKNKSEVRGYIAKFETCNLEGNFGTVFLLLQPKIIQSSHAYPDIYEEKKQQNSYDFNDYSYAIYERGELVSQKGDYPYRLEIPRKFSEEQLFPMKGYNHYISSPQTEITIIISKRKDYLVKSFALFSFMFIFFTALGVAFALLWTGIFIIRFGWQKFMSKHRSNTPVLDILSRAVPIFSSRQRLLSTRIQVSMVGLVFFGLIVSVFFTIQYVRYNYNDRQQDQLYLKLKEILNQLENEPDLGRKLKSSDRLRALVNQLSDANRIDLNIFDKNGHLLASTQPDIYTQNLLAPVMHPEAFFTLKNQNASQLLQRERVTELEFLSGYVPLFDYENKIRAYLNLPYFTEKSEIDKEISSFLVSLINIYFLLLLLAIVTAYFIGQRISSPLQLIREKLSQTSIASKNEIIEWKREDEIGQLVKQYNKMVLELEESTLKLSQSEREGAWKEMARQVAHEIKNPLTPMKLNIQHLQRAWGGEKEKLDATFKRVTEILIEQIDSLSRLATEFSSFAQMPTDQFMDCRIDEILHSTLHLFEQSENVEFVYDKKLEAGLVRTDPEQIRRVFTNIIKNAIQSIPSEREGIIRIEYKRVKNEVLISIEDNGDGMDDDVKQKIFVPSFSTKNSGMGLGLAISKKIIENSKGKIWFNSQKGKGSKFFISLPLLEG